MGLSRSRGSLRSGFDRNDLLFIEYVEMARQWTATAKRPA